MKSIKMYRKSMKMYRKSMKKKRKSLKMYEKWSARGPPKVGLGSQSSKNQFLIRNLKRKLNGFWWSNFSRNSGVGQDLKENLRKSMKFYRKSMKICRKSMKNCWIVFLRFWEKSGKLSEHPQRFCARLVRLTADSESHARVQSRFSAADPPCLSKAYFLSLVFVHAL